MPRWTIRPCSTTRIASARRTVASRCAMMIDVRPRQQPVESALDQDLAGAVDVRSRLVEDEDARVGEERARDRDQLALAGGKPGTALAHDVVEPVLEPRGDAVDADRRSCRGDLCVRRVGLGEADVVGDRAAEQERILQDHSELPPVAAKLDVAKVDVRPPGLRPSPGRRTGRSASPSSTCRRPTRPPWRCSHLPARRSTARARRAPRRRRT